MLEPSPNPAVWGKDLKEIKSLGFNSVRMWIDWATAEPREGQYNFTHLDTMLTLAGEAGLRVIVQVYMDSAPAWVGKKFPDGRFVSSNGMVIEPESSPGYCRDHAGVHAAEVRFYEALARRAARSPAFHGWDLWSEPHVINWANPTYIERPEFCFCAHTKARFRSWLKKKYGTLDALNRVWYRGFDAWEDVEPNRLSTILSYSDYIDWKAFLVDKLGEDLRARFDAVKRGAPRAVATSHAAGVGLFASPHYWEGQSDDWVMARQVDFYGTSFYPKHSAFVDRDPIWRGALLDFTRSFGFAEGRPGFWIGELQAGTGTIALNVSPPVTEQDTRIWTWSALARGAKAVCTYAWYPMSTGYESGGFGLIELDGAITPRARAAGEIARLVDRNATFFAQAQPPRAEVAVIYNPLAHFVGGRQRQAVYGGPQGEVAGIERDALLGFYRALWSSHVPIDFVHMDRLGDLAQYKLIYLPYPLMMPEAAAPILRAYVERGGALVAEARLGWNNERGRAADRIPGFGLDTVFGAREQAVGTVNKPVLRWLDPPSDLPGRWYQESLRVTAPDRAKVVAQWPDGNPAAVASTFGKGKTLLVGSFVSAAAPVDSPWFSRLLDWAGVARPPAMPGVEMRWLENGPDRVYFLFRHEPEPASVTLPPGVWTDLATGRLLPERTLKLEGRSVAVLRLTERRNSPAAAP
jgi:beta-galactosidase